MGDYDTNGLRESEHNDIDRINLIYFVHVVFTYSLLAPCSRVVLQKLTGSQLVKKFPAFYGTRRLITTFASARHLSLSWARSIQAIPPHPTSWRSIYAWVSQVFFPLRFPHPNPVYTSPHTHMRYMPRPSHSSRFYHPNYIWWPVQVIKMRSCTTSNTSSVMKPNGHIMLDESRPQQHCKKQIVFQQVVQCSPWRWCMTHRNMWERFNRICI